MAKTRRPTIARGAVIERDLVQRYLRRLMKQVATQGHGPRQQGYIDCAQDVSGWLKEQPRRTRRRGGIGR